MHLLVIIVVAILIAGFVLQNPSLLGRFAIGFAIPIVLLVLLGLLSGH